MNASRFGLIIALAAAAAMASCEDALTPVAAERVRLSSLAEYTLTLLAPPDGSIGPSPGTYAVKHGEPFEVSATANSGFSFLFWEQVGGSGSVSFEDEDSASTKLRVVGGDVAVRPRIDDTSYVLTVVASPAADGNAVSVPSVNVEQGIPSSSIGATPGAEYIFVNWTVISGSPGGVVFSPGAASSVVTVTASAGDATIQANFAKKSYTLTVQYQDGGYGSPSGGVSVVSGANRAINAYPYGTYLFDGWEKVSGAGTVSFANAASPNTTASLVGGSATIRARFRKEVITLSEVGSFYPPNTSTYPNQIQDMYVSGTQMFVFGDWSGADSVIRKIDIANPVAPSSGLNDYRYIGGVSRGLTGNGSTIIAGAQGNLFSLAQSGFGSGSALSAFSPAAPTLQLNAGDSQYFWALHGSTGSINMYSYATRTIYSNIALQSSGWGFRSFALASGSLFAVEEDNGAHRLAAYNLVGQGGAFTEPHSYDALHGGFDMDPGSAGRLAVHPDGEMLVAPVVDEAGVARLRFYDATTPEDIAGAHQGTATLSGSDLNDVYYGDYYVYAAGVNGGSAFVSVVDASAPNAPTVVRTLTIGDFGTATRILERAGHLFVWVDDAKSGTNQKAVLKVYLINAN